MTEIKSTDIVLVPVSQLFEHPKNMHVHSDEQIDQLIRLIEYQGFRTSLIVQKGTNLVVAGCGRLKAARKMGLEKVPVSFQEFESESQLYAFIVSDNAIGKDQWAKLDYAMINSELENLGPMDISLLGIKDFVVEPMEIDLPDLKTGEPDFQQVTFILSNEQKDILDDAMAKAKKEEDCTDEINQNSNGNVISAILKKYVNS